MNMRRALCLFVFCVFTAVSAPCQQPGATMTEQAPAGEAPAAPAAPPAAAPKPAVPHKKKTGAVKPAKAKKKEHYVESKYKSRAIVENTETSYRFDAEGNSIDKSKVKPKALKGKAAPAKPAEKPSCSAEEPCTGKSSDADSL